MNAYDGPMGSVSVIADPDQRELAALAHEEQAAKHRALGEFEAAARWDDYARAVRLRGTSSGVTANGTNAAWSVVAPQVSYIDT